MGKRVRLYVNGAYIHDGTQVWVHDQCGESLLFRDCVDSERADACLRAVWDFMIDHPHVGIVNGLLEAI